MRILYAGDIVGAPGRRAFTRTVARLRGEAAVDFVVCNGENAAGGRGITADLADSLFDAGADVITLGDHTWDQKEIMDYLPNAPHLLRPANFPAECPGSGIATVDTASGPVTVMICIGRVFMNGAADCPFHTADELIRACGDRSRVILAEIHAEATSEKIAFGRYLEGRVSAVVGSHTHVQTSDDTVLPQGTAYITDLGMTGPKDSVLGREVEPVVKRLVTGMPARFGISTKGVALEGVLLDIDETTGKARSIERIREQFED